MRKRKQREFETPDGIIGIFELGKQADALLKNTAFIIAYNNIERDLFNIFKNSGSLDSDEREAVYAQLQALKIIRMKLTGMVNEWIIEKKNNEELLIREGEIA